MSGNADVNLHSKYEDNNENKLKYLQHVNVKKPGRFLLLLLGAWQSALEHDLEQNIFTNKANILSPTRKLIKCQPSSSLR